METIINFAAENTTAINYTLAAVFAMIVALPVGMFIVDEFNK